MKQSFSKKQHDVFKKYANIQNNPWEWDIKYLNKSKKYLKYVKWIPWLYMIWVGNSIAMNNGKKSSDIDLYVVTSEQSIWFVRILLTFIFQLLWVRKTIKRHEGRFCLSFFSTKKWMNFSNFALKNDIYLFFWIVYFKPILNYNNTYEKFLKVNTSWADLSEYQDIIDNNKKHISFSWNRKKEIWKSLQLINKFLKTIFLKKTMKTFENLWKPFWIIINDNMLKFHNNDVRKKCREECSQNSQDLTPALSLEERE
jgi:hypothetical protein